MTVWVPGWMQGGTYLAQQDRINGSAADWDEGVNSRTDLKVSQRGAGANMSVDVAIGGGVITGDDQANQGNYTVFNDAVFNLTGFTAPVSNSRYDIVGLQLNDPNAGGAAGSNAVFNRVVGTASASPVIPTIPASFLALAIIGPILTSTTSITTGMIHDAHTGTGPTGVTGIRLCKGFRDTAGNSKETYNTVAPNGWLMEFGQAVSRTTFARLFEHLGITFGPGDGSTTFNVPDSRGKVAIALDNMGGVDAGIVTMPNALGGTGGEEKHTLITAELASHSHTNTVGTESAIHHHNTGAVIGSGIAAATGSGFTAAQGSLLNASGPEDANHNHTVTIDPAGSGTAHNNLQPYILLNRMIRT